MQLAKKSPIHRTILQFDVKVDVETEGWQDIFTTSLQNMQHLGLMLLSVLYFKAYCRSILQLQAEVDTNVEHFL